MRRGGLLILLIGLILIVGAVALFLFLQTPGAPGTATGATPAPPTEVPQVEIVRARVDIPAGTVIADSATLLEVTRIPQPQFNESDNYARIGDVEGMLTTRAVRAGEFLTRNALTEPGLSQQLPTAEPDRARDKAYPLIVNNLSGVADQLKPGDFVDVVATFFVQRRQVIPIGTEFVEVNGEQIERIVNETTDPTYQATKTLLQRAQVLRVIKPVVAEGEPTPEAGLPPQSGSVPQVDESGQAITPGSTTAGAPSTLTSGIWTLVLAVNNQEIELIEFALAADARIVLVLRGAGDTTFEPTLGVTYDLLVSEFGLPLPRALPPRVVSEQEVFTPEPTRTPAPTRVP
jgi:pilus assembly protein CpaB